MKRSIIKIKETIATVIADESFLPLVYETILAQRHNLEEYIIQDPDFASSLLPYDVAATAPEIVRSMSQAGKKVNVGPMAAVAGAIAYYVVKTLVNAGAQYVIFDNGGDIAFFIDKPVIVGIYTGSLGVKGLGLKVQPRSEIFGICTSSGSVGHSLSFGNTDAATVISKDVILADATATALGNAIKTTEPSIISKSMKGLLLEDIEGMIVAIRNVVATCGNIPQIIKVKENIDLISKA